MDANSSSLQQCTRKDRLLDVQTVARWLSLSPRAVRNLAKAGVLPAFRLGIKLWRFRECDVQAFLNAKGTRHA
ncbi:MAG: helix-turn-helix domain-containing protein [Acidobacteriales bacterium]|nr:helix-turn-helix domain-containing protein [Terriglobales bacterium]